jgi:hypothetical protein
MKKIDTPLESKQAKENWSSLRVQNISPYGHSFLMGKIAKFHSEQTMLNV